MKKVLLAVVAILAMTMAAQANTLTLEQVVGNLFQQTVQSPCIFSNPSCQNGSFPTTNLDTGGAVTGYNVFSQVYTGSTLLSILNGGAMILGIDINQASGQPAQTLLGFQMLKNGVVVDTFTGSTGNVPAGNNGNGYADYLLGNFSSFTATDTIQFRFIFSDANDGTENVFIISGGRPPTNVPEPSTVLLVGAGLLFVGAFRRKIGRLAGRA
jgi:PEP-CTERM motif-containing protein